MRSNVLKKLFFEALVASPPGDQYRLTPEDYSASLYGTDEFKIKGSKIYLLGQTNFNLPSDYPDSIRSADWLAIVTCDSLDDHADIIIGYGNPYDLEIAKAAGLPIKLEKVVAAVPNCLIKSLMRRT